MKISTMKMAGVSSTDKEHLAAVPDPQGVSRAPAAAGRFPGGRASPCSGPRASREIGSATRRNSGQPAPWQQPAPIFEALPTLHWGCAEEEPGQHYCVPSFHTH